MNILLVEDEKPLSRAIQKILEQQGWHVDPVYDGVDAVDYACAMDYQLIILDVMLPGRNGFEALRMMRAAGMNAPVLMLTARSSVPDKVQGLNTGADDYMTKPFDTDELLARVRALTRRTGEVIVDALRYEDLALDIKSATLRCGGESVQLSRKEFEVLQLFLRQPTMTWTKDALLTGAWGTDSEATENSVEVYISFLRKKLKYLKSRVSIRNLQKIGYRLEVEPC